MHISELSDLGLFVEGQDFTCSSSGVCKAKGRAPKRDFKFLQNQINLFATATNRAGQGAGTADGVIGPRTVRAVKIFGAEAQRLSLLSSHLTAGANVNSPTASNVSKWAPELGAMFASAVDNLGAPRPAPTPKPQPSAATPPPAPTPKPTPPTADEPPAPEDSADAFEAARQRALAAGEPEKKSALPWIIGGLAAVATVAVIYKRKRGRQ
jgi:lysozyme family protein